MNNKVFNDSSSGERIGFSVDCCVDCGGSLLGNGLTMPIHCENIESPDCACPDEGPFYCGNNERKAALDRAFSHYGTMCNDTAGRVMMDEFDTYLSLAEPRKDRHPVIVMAGGGHIDIETYTLGVAVCNAGKSAQQMGRLLRNGEDLFYPRDIKSIRGGFSVFMVGPLLKLKPFEYYYQTKFGAFSRNKHPRGNKFQRAVWSVKVANVWGNN